MMKTCAFVTHAHLLKSMRRGKVYFYSVFMGNFLQLLINMYAEKTAPLQIPSGYLNFIVPEVKGFCICERSFPGEIFYHQHTENCILKWEREEDRRIPFSQKNYPAN